MISPFPNPVPPFPGWVRRIYRLSRPVSDEDIRAFLGKEELYTRDTPSVPVNIIHKFGLLEIHCIPGESVIEVWYNPEKESYSSEYLDALLATRFS
jgi:hypothetical protein